jgi:hypothetical protein
MSRPTPFLKEVACATALPASPEAGATGIDLVELGAAASVFIHSSWRTASTWLWGRLRQAPTAIAYCEIFHERLQTCTIRNLKYNDFAKWNSKHPQTAPYFLEFAPLVGADGVVRGFDPSMAVDRFMPAAGIDGELSVGERAYIEGLIANASERRRIAVLTDTRTLGRFKAIARAFPGRHVLLVRNLFHQWASYSEQCADGNRYFLEMLFQTVAASRRDPFVALIADWFADDNRSETSVGVFQLFLLFHLYLYAHVYDSADCVVDVNRIAADPDARRDAEAILSDYLRSPIDLSDARTPFGLSLFSVASKSAFVDEIDQFVKLMVDGSISGGAAEFVARAKNEALAEWEKSEFYSRASRSYFMRRLNPANPPSEAKAKPPRLRRRAALIAYERAGGTAKGVKADGAKFRGAKSAAKSGSDNSPLFRLKRQPRAGAGRRPAEPRGPKRGPGRDRG